MMEIDPRTLRNDLLRQVSRSFFLSMRVLPRGMRDPISLGYLLARASDTLADAECASVALRKRYLDQFREVLSSRDADDVSQFYVGVVRDFSPKVTHPGERELLQRLPEVIGWLNRSGEEEREAVIGVLETITEGQSSDLLHFADARPGSLACLGTSEDLDRYTYRVAGCVGEFWTSVGYLAQGFRFAPREEEAFLRESGRSLGQGLQLVNILRDLGEDLRQGRCYLPSDELEEAGWDGDKGQGLPAGVWLPVARRWQEHCRGHLARGWEYLDRLKRGRARYATALPLILAEETLDRIEAAGEKVLEKKVKVTRSEVRKALLRAATR